MPELPEVQTTVNGLNATIKCLTIADVWTDLAQKTVSRPDYIESVKYAPFFTRFKKAICGAKILKAERRAKNILIHLSSGQTILIHLKMTGHLLYGRYAYNKKTKEWTPDVTEKNDALRDPFNRFLHVVFTFTNGKQLALSDVRKFAKVTLLPTTTILKTKELSDLGPEPLDKKFTQKVFNERLNLRPQGKIKTVLLEQNIISGIGNIYSDEALWLSGIHPLSIVSCIPAHKRTALFKATISVLQKGISFGGDSTSDYRQIDGTRGRFSAAHNAYRLTGKPCKKKGCSGIIHRIALGGRGAHFCPVHQSLFV